MEWMWHWGQWSDDLDGIQGIGTWSRWMGIKEAAQIGGNVTLENHLKGIVEDGKAHGKEGSRSDNKRKMQTRNRIYGARLH